MLSAPSLPLLSDQKLCHLSAPTPVPPPGFLPVSPHSTTLSFLAPYSQLSGGVGSWHLGCDLYFCQSSQCLVQSGAQSYSICTDYIFQEREWGCVISLLCVDKIPGHRTVCSGRGKNTSNLKSTPSLKHHLKNRSFLLGTLFHL